jgi:hypothetical protein
MFFSVKSTFFTFLNFNNMSLGENLSLISAFTRKFGDTDQSTIQTILNNAVCILTPSHKLFGTTYDNSQLNKIHSFLVVDLCKLSNFSSDFYNMLFLTQLFCVI